MDAFLADARERRAVECLFFHDDAAAVWRTRTWPRSAALDKRDPPSGVPQLKDLIAIGRAV